MNGGTLGLEQLELRRRVRRVGTLWSSALLLISSLMIAQQYEVETSRLDRPTVEGLNSSSLAGNHFGSSLGLGIDFFAGCRWLVVLEREIVVPVRLEPLAGTRGGLVRFSLNANPTPG